MRSRHPSTPSQPPPRTWGPSWPKLPELKSLWSTVDFHGWENEAILRPALHDLEITFRLVSGVLSDPQPYSDRRRWERSLKSLASSQVEIISLLVEDEEVRRALIVDLSSSGRVLPAKEGSFAEVWKGEDVIVVVNHTSEGSLLSQLATWQKSKRVAKKILFSIKSRLRRCLYTLGLRESNLAGKPSLDYEATMFDEMEKGTFEGDKSLIG